MKKQAQRPLKLALQSVRVLTDDQLDRIIGGKRWTVTTSNECSGSPDCQGP